MVIGAGNVQRDVTLEFAQSECRMSLRVVFAKLLGIAERRARQQVEFSHLRPNQTLDVSTEAWLPWRPPVDRDAGILASPLERLAPKIGAVVDV